MHGVILVFLLSDARLIYSVIFCTYSKECEYNVVDEF